MVFWRGRELRNCLRNTRELAAILVLTNRWKNINLKKTIMLYVARDML